MQKSITIRNFIGRKKKVERKTFNNREKRRSDMCTDGVYQHVIIVLTIYKSKTTSNIDETIQNNTNMEVILAVLRAYH